MVAPALDAAAPARHHGRDSRCRRARRPCLCLAALGSYSGRRRKTEKLRAALTHAGLFSSRALPISSAARFICTVVVFLVVLAHGVAIRRHAHAGGLSRFSLHPLFVILLKVSGPRRATRDSPELAPLVDVLLKVLNIGVSIDQCLRYSRSSGTHRSAPPASVQTLCRRHRHGMSYETAF